MTDHRRRPPKHSEAMTGAERQLLSAKARQRDMAEVAYALKHVLSGKANRNALIAADCGATCWNTAGANAPLHWKELMIWR
jgi:hypothetical protein